MLRLGSQQERNCVAMMRLTAAVIVGWLAQAGAVHAQDTSVNVNSLSAYELNELPVIDGDLSDPCWTGLSDILVDKLGDAPASEEPGDLDVVSKAAWDEETNCLCFAVRLSGIRRAHPEHLPECD